MTRETFKTRPQAIKCAAAHGVMAERVEIVEEQRSKKTGRTKLVRVPRFVVEY